LDLPTAFWHEWVYACRHQGWQIPQDLHCVIIGGEAVQAERVKDWELLLTRSPAAQNTALINTYGPSEAAVVATSQHHLIGALDLGKPLAGRQAVVLDEHGRWLAKGQSGELVLTGGGIGLGFWQQPDTSERAFATLDRYLNLPWAIGLRCYRTGDRVCMRADGTLVYQGRLDDQIKISGQRIDPLEVEQALLNVMGIKQAAVVVRKSRGHSRFLAAFVVSSRADSYAVDSSVIRQHLSKVLPAAMVPSCIVFVEQLP
jgi:nonribosomal peptide synthetase MxcG